MRSPLALRLAAACVLTLTAYPALGQSALGWEAYPSFNELSVVTAAPDGLWAASRAGVFFYGVPDGELRTITTVDGLTGGPVGGLAVDAERGTLWVGYENGVLDRVDTETGDVDPVYALARADQYASRGVRRLRLAGDRLYAATDFGVVVIDAEAGTVAASYTRIGDLQAGSAINDVVEAPLPDGRPGLWVGAEGGLYYAPLGGATLQAPGAWTPAEQWEGSVFTLAVSDGTLYVGGGPTGARDLYERRPDGGYERRLFIDNPILAIDRGEGQLTAVSEGQAYALLLPSRTGTTYSGREQFVLRDGAVGPDGRAWVADAVFGLFALPETDRPERVTVDPQTVAPAGPLSTAITGLDVADDGTVWAVTERLEFGPFASINRLDEDGWTSFRSTDPTVDVARVSYRSVTVGPDGAAYVGSGGDGLTVFRDGTATTYRPDNSSLLPASGTDDFVVVTDVAVDDDGVAWVLNASGRPLHAFDGASWRGFAFPPGIASTTTALRIAIDGFGQKWLALDGAGLGVWDTGDLESAADDRARTFSGATGNGTGLPDAEVRDVVFDGERVWIGTARGIAYVFSPGSAFAGDAGLATPQWPVLADGSDYLLRDVEVFDLEVDPAGQLWVATSSGAYLVNAEGDGLVRTVTAEASPLPSDGVFSVGVDPSSGRVYFVTAEGLFSSPGAATRPVRGSETLVTAPSPYRPSESPGGVVVSGLSAPVSQVRVLTVAGDVVYATEVRGGSFQWNGRDDAGRPVSSGVYIVSASGSDGTTRIGKVAVLR